MSIFKLDRDGKIFIFPAFKFQEEKYASSMLEDGNVHLSNISIFRDSSRFTGQIYDEREGVVTLHNNIQPSSCGYYAQSGKSLYPKNLNVTVSDAYVFCCTKYFLSDSLTWAISEGKECCVLITDVDEYIGRISNHFKGSLDFIGARECQYIGRDFFVSSPTPYEKTNYFIGNPINAAFVKPKEYQSQRELRLLWKPKSSANLKESINSNVETCDLLLPIRFHDFDVNLHLGSSFAVGAKVITKSGKGNANFHIQVPNEVFSPVIHMHQGKKMLGFLSTSNVLIGGKFVGGQVGLCQTSIGNIVCNVYLDDIECIEIFKIKA